MNKNKILLPVFIIGLTILSMILLINTHTQKVEKIEIEEIEDDDDDD